MLNKILNIRNNFKIILFFLLFILLGSLAYAQSTIYVPDAYATIQAAINAANESDTIIVRDGAYIENIYVNKRLTIKSENGADSTIVQAANPSTNVFQVVVPSVEISGFTIKGATGCPYDNMGNRVCKAGILIGSTAALGTPPNTNYGRIFNNIITGNYYGILLARTSYGMVDNNIISGNTQGIQISGSLYNILNNNTISDGSSGILLYSYTNRGGNTLINNTIFNMTDRAIDILSDDNVLDSNKISGNNLGILLWTSYNNILTGNSMFDNLINFLPYNYGQPFYPLSNALSHSIDESNTVDGKPLFYIKNAENKIYDASSNAGAIYIFNSNNITVKDLILTKNGHSVYFGNVTSSKIENVVLSNNAYGISLYYSNHNHLDSNTMLNNLNSGTVLLYSDNNTISKNNMLDRIYLASSNNNTIYLNNFNNYIVSSSTNLWNSQEPIAYTHNSNSYTNYLGNYWGDYTGSDADGDGIGDTPYSIDGDNDNYPLMKPFETYFVPQETCSDNIKNQDETDVDCGGSCSACENGKSCNVNSDCQSGFCYEEVCTLENQPPIADAGAGQWVSSGDLVIFNASNSTDPDGPIVSYQWDFGDNETATGPIVTHRFRGHADGLKTYSVTLTVEDDKGVIDTDTVHVVVEPLEKTVNISLGSDSFVVAKAIMKVMYNWVNETNGEDVYIISEIYTDSIAIVGIHQISITRDIYQLWSDVLLTPGAHYEIYTYPFTPTSVFGVEPTITSLTFPEGTFEGIEVHASDKMNLLVLGATGINKLYGDKASTAFNPTAPVEYPLEPYKYMPVGEALLTALNSPGELRIYDSQGHVTGLVNGEIIEEIPNSTYFNETIIILSPSDSYTYEVVGTNDGVYGLTVVSVEYENVTNFTATDIPIINNSIHQYLIDWEVISQGEDGVTIQVDSDGDGAFEKTITADNNLTEEEFMDPDGDGVWDPYDNCPLVFGCLEYDGCDKKVYWLPPLSLSSFSIQAGSTLPIKFNVTSCSGDFVEDKSVMTYVFNKENISINKTSIYGEGSENVRINSTEGIYITNFHTKDYPEGNYTIDITLTNVTASIDIELNKLSSETKGKAIGNNK